MLSEREHEFGTKEESLNTVIIGGGQAGLAVGYFLARQGENFIILDKNSRSGDAWRYRWESLRLFTPSQFDSLPGMPFPKSKNYFPSKDDVADYLEEYASNFNLPVHHNVKVENLNRYDKGYQIITNTARFSTRNVIVATGPYHLPFIPNYANQLTADIIQLHSSAYLNPKQIPANAVLVVGAGNSGAEIALELSRAGKKVWLSGRDVGRVPANSPLGKLFDGRLIWWFMTHVLTMDTLLDERCRYQHFIMAFHWAALSGVKLLRRESFFLHGYQASNLGNHNSKTAKFCQPKESSGRLASNRTTVGSTCQFSTNRVIPCTRVESHKAHLVYTLLGFPFKQD